MSDVGNKSLCWEHRTIKAEADVERLKKEVDELKARLENLENPKRWCPYCQCFVRPDPRDRIEATCPECQYILRD